MGVFKPRVTVAHRPAVRWCALGVPCCSPSRKATLSPQGQVRGEVSAARAPQAPGRASRPALFTVFTWMGVYAFPGVRRPFQFSCPGSGDSGHLTFARVQPRPPLGCGRTEAAAVRARSAVPGLGASVWTGSAELRRTSRLHAAERGQRLCLAREPRTALSLSSRPSHLRQQRPSSCPATG